MSIMQFSQTIHIMPPLQSKPHKKSPVQPTLPGLEPEKQPNKVTNRQIAEVLSSIADLIASQNGNTYRIAAYRNAARGVLDLPEPVADILARGEELILPGLGDRLRSRIMELVRFGSMTFQSGLYMQTLPAGIRALLAVEHIGPYTAIRLHEELSIDSLEKLWWAAQQQRIRRLPGFGPRSETRLKEAAEQILKRQKKNPLEGVA